MEIDIDGRGVTGFCREAFLLAVPHIGRLKTLSASSWRHQIPSALLPVLVEHFSCPVPFLKTLKIDLTRSPPSTLPDTLFNGDLSSLHELYLTAVLVPLPWKSLENLTIFNLSNAPSRETILAHLLDFFGSAPRLRDIELEDSVPTSSNAPSGRIVLLPNLRELRIIGCPANLILLDHLSIPPGAIVTLVFGFRGAISPIPSRIPDALDNLHNLSHITGEPLLRFRTEGHAAQRSKRGTLRAR